MIGYLHSSMDRLKGEIQFPVLSKRKHLHSSMDRLKAFLFYVFSDKTCLFTFQYG